MGWRVENRETTFAVAAAIAVCNCAVSLENLVTKYSIQIGAFLVFVFVSRSRKVHLSSDTSVSCLDTVERNNQSGY